MAPRGDKNHYKEQRRRLVEESISYAGVTDKRVLKAMMDVPRHMFVPKEYKDKAYIDITLPIGEGQTISQPSLVGIMTQVLNLKGGERVLEIGTGSGYQAAILGLLAREVYSIEIIERLYKKAEKTIKKLGYKNIHLYLGDGSTGCIKHSPFDAILVAAGCVTIPASLIEQLANDGRIIVPAGQVADEQRLILGVKKHNKFICRDIGAVRFVPLVEKNN